MFQVRIHKSKDVTQLTLTNTCIGGSESGMTWWFTLPQVPQLIKALQEAHEEALHPWAKTWEIHG